MSVGIAFLRPRIDGTWEGDYISVGGGTFWEFHELLLSLPGVFLLPGFREDEYDIDVSEGSPPYPAQVTPELAEDLKKWLKYEGVPLLAALRQVPLDQVEEYIRPLKSLMEKRLAEGYAIMVSY